jgi:hypothetical protein
MAAIDVTDSAGSKDPRASHASTTCRRLVVGRDPQTDPPGASGISDDELAALLHDVCTRPLDGEPYPYLHLEVVRDPELSGPWKDTVVATGVTPGLAFHPLTVALGDSADPGFWRSLFADLLIRGLSGVGLAAVPREPAAIDAAGDLLPGALVQAAEGPLALVPIEDIAVIVCLADDARSHVPARSRVRTHPGREKFSNQARFRPTRVKEPHPSTAKSSREGHAQGGAA